MICTSGITGVASHGKHTRATEHVKKLGNQKGKEISASKIWAPKFPRKRLWQFCPSGKFCSILFPNFFTCSVTPCMLTMTMLPERMMVRVHYLAHDRQRVLLSQVRIKWSLFLFEISVCVSVCVSGEKNKKTIL